MSVPEKPVPRWTWWLLLAAALWRLAYVVAQGFSDPTVNRPAFDGAYYVDWARSLAASGAGPEGAFYLAPLYPHLLSLVFRMFGDGMMLPFVLQQCLAVGAAVALAFRGRHRIGAAAPLAACLMLLHHPLAYFSSRPLGESIAVPLLILALLAAWEDSDRGALASGLLGGLAVLARPNLLLVFALWVVGTAWSGRHKKAVLLLAGIAILVLPVTLRNLARSGHPVLVSSNAGITLYHGNGPGALGTFTAPSGFAGGVQEQRLEATALARIRSGEPLDAVEADQWWGDQALRTRMQSPGQSLGLLLRRAALMLDSHEIGLDYPPTLDANPLRLTWRLPRDGEVAIVSFAVLLGLATIGGLSGRQAPSGTWRTWSAIAACAATPLIFYMASRYRLPLAALLTIPAGCGLVTVFGLRVMPASQRRRRIVVGILVALASSAAYCFVPGSRCDVVRNSGLAQGLSHRALAYRDTGDMASALADAERSIALSPRSAAVRYNYGVVQRSAGRLDLAEIAFVEALQLEPPGRAAAAGDLAQLWIGEGQAARAVPMLRTILAQAPTHQVCWNNLVIGLHELGRYTAALEALETAGSHGIRLHPDLERRVRNSVKTGEEDAADPEP